TPLGRTTASASAAHGRVAIGSQPCLALRTRGVARRLLATRAAPLAARRESRRQPAGTRDGAPGRYSGAPSRHLPAPHAGDWLACSPSPDSPSGRATHAP